MVAPATWTAPDARPGGTGCGNGTCELDEEKGETCPEDCNCAPEGDDRCGFGGVWRCLGTGRLMQIRRCAECVETDGGAMRVGVCGNEVCDKAKDADTCEVDCDWYVQGRVHRVGDSVRWCGAAGVMTISPCEEGLTCALGQCVTPGICANHLCESCESASCLDCTSACGDGVRNRNAGESPSTCFRDCSF